MKKNSNCMKSVEKTLSYNSRDYAWSIVKKVFAYTNHTVMTEALEKWSEDLMGKLIPRHLELIHLVNLKFLEEVEKRFPGDGEKRREMSIVEEGETKMIRMPQLVRPLKAIKITFSFIFRV